MSSFTTPIRVEYIAVDQWRLLEPFIYYVGEEGSDDAITVPAGFVTDFASIPRWLWSIFPPAGAWAKASVIHDYLYRTQTRTKAEADHIFLEAMEVLGVGWFKRRLMYRAVRWFGRYKPQDDQWPEAA